MSDIVERMARAGFAWQIARQGLRLQWEDAHAALTHRFWRHAATHCLTGCAVAPLARMAGFTPEEYTARSVMLAVAADEAGTIKPGFMTWEQLPKHCRQYFRDLAAAMVAVPHEAPTE